jgi:flagellar hook protein FlgE
MADDSGNIMSATPVTNIILPIGSLFPARATTAASLTGNLDASAETGKVPFIGDTANASFSGNLGATAGAGVPFIGNATNASFSGNLTIGTVADPAAVPPISATTFVKQMAVVDSSGNAQDVAVTFVKTVNSDPVAGTLAQWTWTATDPSGTATGTGTVEFNADGSYSPTSAGNTITGTGWGTAGDIVITLDLTNMTQTNASFSVTGPAATSTPPYSKHIVVYDYLGNANDVTVNFAKTVDSQAGISDEWSWTASDPSGTATGTGTITFNADGSYNTSTGTTITCAGWGTGGASDITVDLDVAQMTQTNGPFSPMLSYPVEDQTYQTSMLVYDSLGGTHNTIVNFEKDPLSANTWRWSIGVSGNDEVYINTPTGPSYSGVIEFNPNGTMKTGATANIVIEGAGGLANGTTGDLTKLENGADAIRIALNLSSLVQFDGAFTPVPSSRDGHGSGSLDNITFDDTGTLIGTFTNGNSTKLAQIILADFHNPAGLVKSGGNMYSMSMNSGAAIIGTAGSGIKASIISNSLEGSNVDLANEFTKMIIAQRGFEANSRVVTTSDAILGELINLKR